MAAEKRGVSMAVGSGDLSVLGCCAVVVWRSLYDNVDVDFTRRPSSFLATGLLLLLMVLCKWTPHAMECRNLLRGIGIYVTS
jgi:hypothetical protein